MMLAQTLRDLNRARTQRVVFRVLLCVYVAGFLASMWAAWPYWRFHVFGSPTPGTAPRFTGSVEVVGELTRTRRGWRPPKYFVHAGDTRVEFRCGFRPNFTSCPMGHRPGTDEQFEIGYDEYWGVDYIKYPPQRGQVFIWEGARVIEARRRHAAASAGYHWTVLLFLFMIFFSIKRLRSRSVQTDSQ